MCRFGSFVRQVQYKTTMVNGRFMILTKATVHYRLLILHLSEENTVCIRRSDNFYVHRFGSVLFRESKYTTSP